MVPLDAPLEVESEIAGRDSGFVHPGDPANIKFDTFSYALYGYATGKVTDVSPDSFTNPMMDRAKLLKPQQEDDDTGLGPVYYRAHVSLEELKLHDLPDGFRLTPGMSVTTDIKVGQRTMLGYMLGRIIPHMSESFREP
jgi:HlyD family secretion protein